MKRIKMAEPSRITLEGGTILYVWETGLPAAELYTATSGLIGQFTSVDQALNAFVARLPADFCINPNSSPVPDDAIDVHRVIRINNLYDIYQEGDSYSLVHEHPDTQEMTSHGRFASVSDAIYHYVRVMVHE